MMEDKICMQILSPKGNYDLLNFQQFLLQYTQAVPCAAPEYWNLYDPVCNPFKFNNFMQYRFELGSTPLKFERLHWKRKSQTKAQGTFSPRQCIVGRGTVHMGEYADFDLSVNISELVDYFKQQIECRSADFAYIDLINEQQAEVYRDTGFLEFSDKNQTKPWLYITAHELRHWLPDLCWLTFFGKPYVELFGEEKLAATPIYRVQKIKNIGYLLQITESIYDIEADFEGYRAKVEIAKQHLNRNAFFSQEKAYSLDWLFTQVPKPGSVFDAPVFQELDDIFSDKG